MLVTKTIPIGVPKVTSPHLSCSHTASGSWGTSGCLYFAALNPSLPDFLISPCRTSPSVFTQTRKSSTHYYGKNSSRGGGRQKTMEQASTTRVRKTSSGFPVCKATATVDVLWPSQNSERRTQQKPWGLGPFAYHIEFILEQASPVSLQKHFRYTLALVPHCW